MILFSGTMCKYGFKNKYGYRLSSANRRNADFVGVDPQIDPKRPRIGNVRINGKRPTAARAGALSRRPQRSEFSQVRALMM
jgi:hypothetical protein